MTLHPSRGTGIAFGMGAMPQVPAIGGKVKMILGFNAERENAIRRNNERIKKEKERYLPLLRGAEPNRRPTKRVYICSPLKGDIEKNIRNAEIYCRFAFNKGYIPVTPHIYYPRFLDDNNPVEREYGLRYGLEEMWQCGQLWVFGSRRSEGMKAEIQLADTLEIPIRYFTENLEENDSKWKDYLNE